MRLLASLALLVALAAPAHAAAVSAPSVAVERLALGGAPLYAIQDARLARVSFELHLEAGERFVPGRLAGLSWLAAELLNRGPADMPFETYRRTLFHEGAEIDWRATNRFVIARVRCRPESLKAVSALVRRTARSPRFEDFGTVKSLVVNRRRALSDNMQALTLHYAKQQIWGFKPEARLPEGWGATLARAERPALESFMRERLSRPAGFVAAAGPTQASTLGAALAAGLGEWVRPLDARRAPSPAGGTRRLVILDKPGAADNQIFAISPAPVSLTSKQAVALEVFLAGMGGDLGARLSRTLRVERGLTYHAGSGLRRTEWPSWYVYTFGGVEQTPALVSGIFELFGAARGGLEPDELDATRDRLAKAQAFALETPIEQVAEVASAVGQGLPPGYPFERLAWLERLTPADVAAEAARVADLPQATIVVMGDAAKLRAALAGAMPAGTAVIVKTLAELEQGLAE